MMKHIYLLFLILCPIYVFAAHPVDKCSDIGFYQYNDFAVILTSSASCPSGTIYIDTVTSAVGTDPRPCRAGVASASCLLYAISGDTHSDNAGTYSYSGACFLD